ncbi:MAG: hypothetical protein Q8L95_01915 [Burkholderiales bacterium]|nr:hypothetical protein [Burkholderiales bacterium]
MFEHARSSIMGSKITAGGKSVQLICLRPPQCLHSTPLCSGMFALSALGVHLMQQQTTWMASAALFADHPSENNKNNKNNELYRPRHSGQAPKRRHFRRNID